MTVFIEHLLIKNFQENSLIFVLYQVRSPLYGKGSVSSQIRKNSANKNWYLSKIST